jgi:hypothetical protein
VLGHAGSIAQGMAVVTKISRRNFRRCGGVRGAGNDCENRGVTLLPAAMSASRGRGGTCRRSRWSDPASLAANAPVWYRGSHKRCNRYRPSSISASATSPCRE